MYDGLENIYINVYIFEYIYSKIDLELNKLYNATALTGSPVFHLVDLTQLSNTRYLNIFIYSAEDISGTVSIHPKRCPITDQTKEDFNETSVFNYRQDMYGTGALNLDTYGKWNTENGFFIKFTSYASDSFKSFHYNITNNSRILNKEYNVSIYTESPVFYYVKLVDVTGFLQILVESNDTEDCGTVSIHSIPSPFFNKTIQTRAA